jgi:hypothetical protein
MEKGCSPHGSQEAKEREEEARLNIPFKDKPQIT